MSNAPHADWFVRARYGMFVHFGLYSLLERGEWVMNRERISREAMRDLAKRFDPHRFDAGALCDLAVDAGMRYITFTTMHHDGFRMYRSELSDFSVYESCGRDIVEEVIAAARQRGLRVCLYHTLNNWMDQPDGVDALGGGVAYERFIAHTFERIRELVTRFNPIDVLWYDGWWPFHADGWQSQRMNEMVRSIQPGVLFNGRNGLPGDFSTPEGHLSAPRPWRPWEACMTLNDSWGYHRGDHRWKSPAQVVSMLATVAAGRGNLLLNVGPRGDGSIPQPSADTLRAVGRWIERCGECVFDTDSLTWGLETREGHNGDWNHNGPFTLRGKSLYQLVIKWPGAELTVAGLDTQVKHVELLGVGPQRFTCKDGRVVVTGLPDEPPDDVCPVVRFDCADVPSMYLTGGMRVPTVRHPPYDPCPSDIQH